MRRSIPEGCPRGSDVRAWLVRNDGCGLRTRQHNPSTISISPMAATAGVCHSQRAARAATRTARSLQIKRQAAPWRGAVLTRPRKTHLRCLDGDGGLEVVALVVDVLLVPRYVGRTAITPNLDAAQHHGNHGTQNERDDHPGDKTLKRDGVKTTGELTPKLLKSNRHCSLERLGRVRSFAAPFASRGPLPDSCCQTPINR